jgi:hypothetical protein
MPVEPIKDDFVAVVSSIEQFWLSIVRLPEGPEGSGE